MRFLFATALLALALPQAAAATSTLCASPEAAVAHEAYIPAGGIEHWISIRGERCDNPVVLVVHGGPGNPISPYADALYGAWTGEFTVVQWDQRGAGRTFARNPVSEDDVLTLAQMTSDGVAVAAHVAALLGQDKVILLGGSWGSALSVHMLKARPALFRAYVGSGQLVEEAENLRASAERVRRLATAAGDSEAIAILDQHGAPPWTNPRAFGALRRLTRKYEAKTSTPAPAQWWTPAAAFATPAAQAAYEGGEEVSYLQFVGMRGKGMLSQVDLRALGPAFEVPIYLVHGAEDLVTTPEVARRWFDGVQAPDKAFVLLPATGHDPNEAMLDAQRRLLEKAAEHSPR
jgi:pimeloyl-ACP methyl ester carboxylesterase